MCGRYELNATSKELRSFVGDLYVTDTDMPPAGEQNPGDPLLIVTKNSDGFFPSNARWGLVADHLKYAPSQLLINLRSEGLPTKPYYSRMLKNNRCLIPATAFYEWHSVEDYAKRKMRFSHANGDPIMLAGVFDHEKFHGTTCAILTTSANKIVSAVHERMPVIVPREYWDFWLGYHPEFPKAELAKIMRPCPSEWLQVEAANSQQYTPQLSLEFA